jgi:hypothetical protein
MVTPPTVWTPAWDRSSAGGVEGGVAAAGLVGGGAAGEEAGLARPGLGTAAWRAPALRSDRAGSPGGSASARGSGGGSARPAGRGDSARAGCWPAGSRPAASLGAAAAAATAGRSPSPSPSPSPVLRRARRTRPAATAAPSETPAIIRGRPAGGIAGVGAARSEPARDSAMWRASPKRAAGSLAMARRMAASSAGGRSGRSSRRGGGGALTCFCIISNRLSASKGSRPPSAW